MWENPSSTSTQYGIAYSVSGNQGDEIIITNSSGNEIISFTTDSTYGVVFVSTEQIENGETYTLSVNGNSSSSITVTSTISGSASNGMEMPLNGGENMGMPGEGGRRGR